MKIFYGILGGILLFFIVMSILISLVNINRPDVDVDLIAQNYKDCLESIDGLEKEIDILKKKVDSIDSSVKATLTAHKKDYHDTTISVKKPKSKPTAVKKPKPVKKSSDRKLAEVKAKEMSKPIKDMDWGKTPEAQGIGVGDTIRVVGYSAGLPSREAFIIDGTPFPPWTKEVEYDEIATVELAGFMPSVLTSSGVKKHLSHFQVLQNNGTP